MGTAPHAPRGLGAPCRASGRRVPHHDRVRLRRVSVTSPGYSRRPKGDSWVFLDVEGTPLADEDEVVFGQFGLRLAQGPSADALWARWSEIREHRPSVFASMEPTVRPAGGDTPSFVLVIGAFRNAADAAGVCGVLRARLIDCEVVHRTGAPLLSRT